MCDVLSGIGAALSAGSVVANSAAAGQVASARSRALTEERQRQAAYDAQAQQVNDHSRKLYDDVGGQEAAKAKSLGDYFTRGSGQTPGDVAAGNTAPTETMPQSNSGLVVQEQSRQGAKAQAFGDQQGAALGNLRAFGDVLGGASREQARDAGTIGQINNFRKGSADASAYELEAANQKGAGLKMLGDLMGGAGQLGLSAGLTRNVAVPGLTGGAAATNAVTSLPSFAQPQAVAPLQLGSAFSALPSFSRVGNLFGGH